MDERASPPRYWWLKRLGAAAVVMLALMFGSYYTLGVQAARGVERELAEWRRLQVIQPEDAGGTLADLLDPRNPAFHVQNAVNGLPRHTTEQMEWNNEEHQWPPLTERDVKVMGSFEAGLQPRINSLRAARDAAGEQEYRWSLGPLSVATLLPNLNPMREVCNQIGWAMLLAHHEGNLVRSLELARDNRTLAQASLEYGPVLVSSLVACGIDTAGHARLQIVAGYEPAHRAPQQELELWREAAPDVRRLIDELLSPVHYQRLAEAPVEGEWLSGLGLRNPPPGLGLRAPPRNLLTAPMLDDNAADVLAAYRQFREALIEHHTYPARMNALAELHRSRRTNSVAGVAAGHTFYEFLSYDVEQPVRAFARVQTTGYVAAVALAVRLYEAERGRLPESLGKLVPEYLPRPPEDPFDPAAGPLRYQLIEGLPVVWSVGPNGTDEGGSLRNAEWPASNFAEDYVFPLRYPQSMNYKPLEWLREQQEAQVPVDRPAALGTPLGRRRAQVVPARRAWQRDVGLCGRHHGQHSLRTSTGQQPASIFA